MKKTVELKPNYKHLVQKPYCCGPCSFQMILLRRNLPWIDQEEIAYNLDGFVMTKGMKKKTFIHDFKEGLAKDAGIYFRDFIPKLKKFVKTRKLPLEVNRYPISRIKDVENFIIRNLRSNNDIIANFRLEPIFNTKYGHYSLISKITIDNKKSLVTICDPYGLHKSSYDIELKRLVKGMSKKWDGNERGFIVVKSKVLK